MFKDKCVLLGVTGSIAAYKAAGLASSLVKKGCRVQVIMTENAKHFINPITFEELTDNKCLTDTFDRSFDRSVAHISAAEAADVFIIAPATANVIGKIACGTADDMLTTTVMAAKCPKIIAPAMNTNMYENPIVQSNLSKLKAYGYTVIEPDDGRLACGAEGKGRLPDEDALLGYIEYALTENKDLVGKKVLITAGPTEEAIDPVRFITNRSTGKMGCALAKRAALRGADVTLVCGPINIKKPRLVNTVDVTSAEEMFTEVKSLYGDCDIIIKAAAVADYRPKTVSGSKIKKQDGTAELKLERTADILKYLGEHKRENQFLCGFSMETENAVENSRRKLTDKNLNMIVCNDLNDEGAGFGTDTNRVTLIYKDGEEALPLMTKDEVADEILNRIIAACGKTAEA